MSAEPLPRPATADLAPVLLRVAESARSVARARRVLLTVELEDGAFPVVGGEHVVEEAVLDVVGQAVTACGAGAVVVLDLHREDDGVALDVVDTGYGARSGSVDCPAARAVVEAHGGHVVVASVAGVGTAVRMWWPTVVRAAAAPLGRARLAAV